MTRGAGEFRLWPDSALRTSGFPIEHMTAFGCSRLWTAGGDRAAYERAVEADRAALEKVVTGERFRRALLWQNPTMVTHATEDWLRRRRAGTPLGRRMLRQENLLVKYAQRYHTKNESIGFFGPVGWVSWVDGAPDTVADAVSVSGSAAELDTFRIQVEHRVVSDLARAFVADPTIRRAVRPFRMPDVMVEDRRVRSLRLGTFVLPEAKCRVLAACDGTRTAADIERTVRLAAPAGEEGSDVRAILVWLERAGLVSLDLRVPPTPFPENWLRRFLASVPGDTSVAERVLDDLDRAKLSVAVAGDEAGARAALERARFVVEGVLDGPAFRLGERRDGRDVLIHEQGCSLRLELGRRPREELNAPLGCVLAASRWLTWQVSERFTALLTGILDRDFAEDRRMPGIVAAQVLARHQGQPFRAEISDIVAELNRRWARAAPAPGDRRRVAYPVDEVVDRFAEAFAAPVAPWLSGRYHSPDVMLSATDPEAVANSDYGWVLGELHTAQNTVDQWNFVTAHPRHERLAEWLERDAAGRRWVLPLYPSDTPHVSSRNHPPPFQVSPQFDYLRLVAESPRDGIAPENVIDIGDVWLTRDADGSVVVAHADGRRWQPMEMFGELLGNGLIESFAPYAPAPHRPRVTIGRLTVAREQWRFALDDLGWRDEEDPFERHAAVLAWAKEHGIPRFVFVRCAGEPKPVYVDLASPLLVTMLVRSLQRQAELYAGSEVTVSEMYPGPDELWAPYDKSRRCTSEIRMAFFDTTGDGESDWSDSASPT